MTEEHDSGTSRTEAVREVFESHLLETEQRIEDLIITTDDETGEKFLTAIITVPDLGEDTVRPSNFVRPLTHGYLKLVGAVDFDFPLEVIAYLRTEDGDPTLAVGSFRVSVLWAREHVNDNLSLVELCKMIFETVQSPKSRAEAAGWVPEYELDWRQAEPGPTDEVPSDFDYEDWVSPGDSS